MHLMSEINDRKLKIKDYQLRRSYEYKYNCSVISYH